MAEGDSMMKQNEKVTFHKANVIWHPKKQAKKLFHNKKPKQIIIFFFPSIDLNEKTHPFIFSQRYNGKMFWSQYIVQS